MNRYFSQLLLILLVPCAGLISCDTTDCQALCAPLPNGNFNVERLNVSINEFALNNSDEFIGLNRQMSLRVNDIWVNLDSFTWRQLDTVDEISALRFTSQNTVYIISSSAFNFLNIEQFGKGTFLFTVRINGSIDSFSESDLSVDIESISPICDPSC